MPTMTTLLGFTAATALLVLLPGPNLLYIVGNGISGGRGAALASAVGVELGTLVHVVAAAVGLSTLLQSSALAFTTVKYLGVAYLAWLGIKAIRRGPATGVAAAAVATDDVEVGRTLLRGLLVNVLNPKVSLFFLAFLPQFIDPARGTATQQVLVLGVVFFVVALVIDLAYAFGSGSIASWLARRPRLLRHQDRVAGAIYLGLAGVAAVQGGGPVGDGSDA